MKNLYEAFIIKMSGKREKRLRIFPAAALSDNLGKMHMKRVKKGGEQKMRFFIDTAKVEDIRKANDMGVICGVTTNPSLIAKDRKSVV